MFARLNREPETTQDGDLGAPPGVPAALRATALERWRWGIPLVALATLLRLAWVLAVPTVPVGDFATYRESANYLLEFGSLDHGFIYMPGFVLLLAGVSSLGGDLLAQKMIGVALGGLAAAAIFGITARLADGDGDGHADADADADGNVAVGARLWRARCPCPAAVVATLLYALWPAGVALSSVVGTDVPAAALILLALWALIAWGERRPRRAALGFGALMGIAAYVRAVALPLTLMSVAYWALRRGPRSWRAIARLTALTTAATLVMLLPWALRNRREHGVLSFTDDHGGITALIGANPNSEGTYTRALNTMFKDLTGRSVLDEPHHETDRLAFDLAKDWTRFEPGYALGLVVLKAERLFWSEWHLLYWPIGRPGVLVGPSQRWFAARAASANGIADGFWYGLCALFAAGVALALAERRLRLLALIPFQLALTATYAIFFAEPRYRLPIEMMAFPVAAFALRRLWALARGLATRDHARPGVARVAGRFGVALAAAAALFVLAPAVVDAGERLRATHRWAATVWTIDGRPTLAKWRRHGPARGPSPVSGAPNGVRLALARADAPVEAEIVVAALPPGNYRLRGALEAFDRAPDDELRLDLRSGDGDGAGASIGGAKIGGETIAGETTGGEAAGAATPSPSERGAPARVALDATFAHAGGPLDLVARLAATHDRAPPRTDAGGATAPSVWISAIALVSVPPSVQTPARQLPQSASDQPPR
jgi:hypothetical protein